MITLQHDMEICFAVGSNRKALIWPMQKAMLSALYSRLETPVVGVEPIDKYLSLSKAEQDNRKDIGGFVGGVLSGPRRKVDNVQSRDLLTLDIDTIPPYKGDLIRDRAEAIGCGYLVYPTRKDRPEAPRKRLIMPLSRSVTVDEYDAISRRIAEKIGIEMCDPTTFEPNRLMYWPSCCSDSKYEIAYGKRSNNGHCSIFECSYLSAAY